MFLEEFPQNVQVFRFQELSRLWTMAAAFFKRSWGLEMSYQQVFLVRFNDALLVLSSGDDCQHSDYYHVYVKLLV